MGHQVFVDINQLIFTRRGDIEGHGTETSIRTLLNADSLHVTVFRMNTDNFDDHLLVVFHRLADHFDRIVLTGKLNFRGFRLAHGGISEDKQNNGYIYGCCRLNFQAADMKSVLPVRSAAA